MYINMLNTCGTHGNFGLSFSGKSLQCPKSTWAPMPMLPQNLCACPTDFNTDISSYITVYHQLIKSPKAAVSLESHMHVSSKMTKQKPVVLVMNRWYNCTCIHRLTTVSLTALAQGTVWH